MSTIALDKSDLNNSDESVVYQYFVQQNQDRGYRGICVINFQRLIDLHLQFSILIANHCLKNVMDSSKNVSM